MRDLIHIEVKRPSQAASRIEEVAPPKRKDTPKPSSASADPPKRINNKLIKTRRVRRALRTSFGWKKGRTIMKSLLSPTLKAQTQAQIRMRTIPPTRKTVSVTTPSILQPQTKLGVMGRVPITPTTWTSESPRITSDTGLNDVSKTHHHISKASSKQKPQHINNAIEDSLISLVANQYLQQVQISSPVT